MNPAIDEIAERLVRAERVLFITGAGASADSGLPTYRGIGGLYDTDGTDDGIPIEVALSGEVMRLRPEISWKHLAEIERHCRDAQPNEAHAVIAALERVVPFVLVFTQNVDGFHNIAGSSNVIEIHGNLRHLRCDRCGHRVTVDDYADLAIPPPCPACRSVLRPDVVLFGEALPGDALAHLENELNEGFDLVFSIGTSSLFPYIVEPVLWAHDAGTPTIEINPGETSLSPIVDYRLRLRAAEAMSAIWHAVLARVDVD